MARSSSKITLIGLAELRRSAQSPAHFQYLLPRILGGKPPVVNSEVGACESSKIKRTSTNGCDRDMSFITLDSWSLTSLPLERYKASELLAALNGNSSQAWHRPTSPNSRGSVLLFASGSVRIDRFAGALEIYRPWLLRGDELPRQRKACGRQPHLSERIFDLDLEGQAQPCVRRADGRRWRTHGTHPETREQGGRGAEVPGMPRTLHRAGAARPAV